MDYGHHDPLHSHRVYSLQSVERPPQSLCYDDGKPGDDDGNPYTCPCHAGIFIKKRRGDPSAFRRREETPPSFLLTRPKPFVPSSTFCNWHWRGSLSTSDCVV